MITDYQSANVDLYLDQGDTYYKEFTINYNAAPINLTNLTITANAKRYSNTMTSYQFVVSKVNAVNGIFSLSMSSSITAMLTHGRYVYKVIAVDGTDTITLMQGNILVTN